MNTGLITIEDVNFVCNLLKKELTQEERLEVLNRYHQITEIVFHDNWVNMVEDIIYGIISEKS